MAVDQNETASRASDGRRVRIGTNVVVSTALAVAVVAVAQAIAFKGPARMDMTSSGVNSLSEATENLLGDLEQNIRITSLYFETDREEEDQPRYRRAAQDLIELYEATNRSKVIADWVNPLKDHEKFRDLLARLREKTAFKDEIEAYQSRISKYADELDARMRELVQSELAQLDGLGGGIGGAESQSLVAPVENLLMRWSQSLADAREQVDALLLGENPQYSTVVNEIRSLYRDFSKMLKDIGNYGTEQAQKNPALPPAQADFLAGARARYADLVTDMEAETTALQELEPLKFDDLVRELAPTGNALLVESDDDAQVVDFTSVWPSMQQGAGGRVGFKNRAFKGEEKLTSAILRITHKEQTAVVFVRYGGTSLFMGGFMPGQPSAPYTAMKQQLEDTNFIVKEWDVKTTQTPPVIEPAPTRTIYVVLKPTPPQRGPMGQPSQEPPFGESHRQAVLNAIGDDGRALFIAGWHPGPFGAIPSAYEYNDYLSDSWGIKVDTEHIIVEAISIEPGKFGLQQGFQFVRECDVTDHAIVSGALARAVGLPLCAPLELSNAPPDGAELQPLIRQPEAEGVWAESNVMQLIQQANAREPVAPDGEDRSGPFDLAVAATKGEAKIVVISSAGFATDEVAFSRALRLTSQGLSFVSQNPGNVSLFINSLHWLNDNTKFMDIGKPIDAAVLEVPSESTVKAVQAVTIFVWPMLAVAMGGVAWWVRRR